MGAGEGREVGFERQRGRRRIEVGGWVGLGLAGAKGGVPRPVTLPHRRSQPAVVWSHSRPDC